MKLLIVSLISIIVGFTICDEEKDRIIKKYEADLLAIFDAKDFINLDHHIAPNFIYSPLKNENATINKDQFIHALRNNSIKLFGFPKHEREVIETQYPLTRTTGVIREFDGVLYLKYFITPNKNLKAGFELLEYHNL